MKTRRFYGRRATQTRARIANHDGIVHIVAETGEVVACGMRVSSTPWDKTKGDVTGLYLPADTVATCVPCLAYELPPGVKP